MYWYNLNEKNSMMSIVDDTINIVHICIAIYKILKKYYMMWYQNDSTHKKYIGKTIKQYYVNKFTKY